MLFTGGADNEILVWKTNLGREDAASGHEGAAKMKIVSSSSAPKAKIRASLVGGMQGIDVQRVVGASVAEDRQVIEEAVVKSRRSVELDESEMCKKTADLRVGASGAERTSDNTPKSVNFFHLVL